MGNRRMDSALPNGLERRISSTSYTIRAVGELKCMGVERQDDGSGSLAVGYNCTLIAFCTVQ